MRIVFFAVMLCGIICLANSCGTGGGTSTTTTTTIVTTTTLPTLIRLYYCYPSPSGSNSVGSATTKDGVNFTVEAGSRFGSLADLTAPDVFKESSGKWVLLYSRSASSDPSVKNKLFKANGSSPTGTFTNDNLFNGGDLGNLSTTHKVGSVFYSMVVTDGGIRIANYDPISNGLVLVRLAVGGVVADPAVVQIGTGSYKLYYGVGNDIYCSNSSDGLFWETGAKQIANSEAAGVINLSGKLYFYYIPLGGGDPNQGKIVVMTSLDSGTTFSSAEPVSGLPAGAYDPNPTVYE